MRKLVLFSVVFLVAACATATRTQHLRVGMPRAEMISVMGNPMSMGGDKDGEVLYYQLLEGLFRRRLTRTSCEWSTARSTPSVG